VIEADNDAKADEASVAHDPEPKNKLPEVYWMTRDRINGRLLDKVDVWLVRPEQEDLGRGESWWRAPKDLVDKQDTFHASWTLAEAKRNARTIPETRMECIRVGNAADAVEVPLLN
jgi:hypothetical protein